MTSAAPGRALGRSPVVVAGAILAAIVGSVIVDLLVGASPPGLMAVFGLGGTAVLVLVSKGLVAPALKRPIGSRPGDVTSLDAGDTAAIDPVEVGAAPRRSSDA